MNRLIYAILALLFVVMFSHFEISSQDSCYPCDPSLSIAGNNITDIQVHRVFEGATIDVSFSANSLSLYALMKKRNASYGLFILRLIENLHSADWEHPINEVRPEIAQLPIQNWLKVASHPIQPVIALGSEEGALEIWNLETASSILSLSVGDTPITDLLFHPDGNTIAVVSDNRIAIVHPDDASIQWLPLPPSTDFVANVSFSADGKWLASAADEAVVLWDTDTFLPTVIAADDDTLQQVLFLPQSNHELVTIAGSNMRLWSLVDRKMKLVYALDILEIEADATVTDVALSPDGSVLVAIYNQSKIVVWDTDTGRIIEVPNLNALQRANYPHNIDTVAFSPDGYWLALGLTIPRLTFFFIVP